MPKIGASCDKAALEPTETSPQGTGGIPLSASVVESLHQVGVLRPLPFVQPCRETRIFALLSGSFQMASYGSAL